MTISEIVVTISYRKYYFVGQGFFPFNISTFLNYVIRNRNVIRFSKNVTRKEIEDKQIVCITSFGRRLSRVSHHCTNQIDKHTHTHTQREREIIISFQNNSSVVPIVPPPSRKVRNYFPSNLKNMSMTEVYTVQATSELYCNADKL